MKNITLQLILSKTSSNYEDIQKTGIYKIYHTSNSNICYIGSASSLKKWRKGFSIRWREHLKLLTYKKHHSPFLQRTINKYGIDGIRFEILEFCNPEECIKREQFWLDFYKPFKNKGYNTCKVAGSSLGYKFPENKKANRKPICQYSINGEFIKKWNSLNEAGKTLDINISSIKDCCKKRFKQIKGFIFRYEGELDLPNINEIRQIMKIECIDNNNNTICKGKFSEIRNLVPDKKCAIYKSIKDGKLTKNKYKYKKI